MNDDIIECSCPRGYRRVHVDPHTMECLTEKLLKVTAKQVALSSFGDKSNPINLFETRFGDFGKGTGNDPTRQYLAYVNEIVECYFRKGVTDLSEPLLSTSLHYCMIYLQCSCGELDYTILGYVPYLLLLLRRYEDAIHFLVFQSNGIPLTMNQRQSVEPGEFLYSRRTNQNHAMLNLVDDNFLLPFHSEESPLRFVRLELSFALYLLLIYYKTLVTSEKRKNEETRNSSQRSEQISIVPNVVFDDDHFFHLIEQRIEVVVNTIHTMNPSFLPALIHPGPLKHACVETPMWCPDCPGEAYFAILTVEDTMIFIEGARETLVRKFGQEPEYHASPFDKRHPEAL